MSWGFEVPDIDPTHLELEARFAELYLRAGGRVTQAEWENLSPLDAMALVLAGDRLRVQWHMDQSLADRGPEGAARLMAQLDGGQIFRDLRLRSAVEETGRRLSAPS